MKHILLHVLVAFVLASCVSSPLRYVSTVEDKYNDGTVSVSLIGLAPDGSASPRGLTVQLGNGGNSPITVEWQRSTFYLDGAPNPVYVENSAYGYGDAKGVPPESIVKAGSHIAATAYPANNVTSTAGGWGPPKLAIQPLNSRHVSLSICVSVAGQDRFYALAVAME